VLLSPRNIILNLVLPETELDDLFIKYVIYKHNNRR
jgi:hypothetical protein